MGNHDIEQEIQDKGLTAPRITPDDIERCISGEYYTVAAEAFKDNAPSHQSLNQLTICVLVLCNGYTIVGKSACASPENFDAELGRKIARRDAVGQIWALEGYRLRSKFAEQMPTPL